MQAITVRLRCLPDIAFKPDLGPVTGLPPLPAFARYDAVHGIQSGGGVPRHSKGRTHDGERSATAGSHPPRMRNRRVSSRTALKSCRAAEMLRYLPAG